MPRDPVFEELMARLQAGDEAAATEVFAHFARRLIGLARSRLSPLIRKKVDPEDIVQSVFRSFFLRQADGGFDLQSWDSLWSLLVVITLRKCGHKMAEFTGPKRDVRRETTPPDGASSSHSGLVVPDGDPTPAEAATLADTLEAAMRPLQPREREVFELRLQGHTSAEISARIGRSESTVRWILKRIRTRLQEIRDRAAAE
jgi:RNA polymerase sigma-70 factor (ECF subfamily)